jgi:hypothetical protein
MTVFQIHSSRKGAVRTNACGPTAQLDFARTIETTAERAVRYVYDVELPVGNYKIDQSIDDNLVLHIPTIVFPVGDIQPVHVAQTLTTTTQGRPVMNKGIVRNICQIVSGDDDVAPDKPQTIYISPLKTLNGVMVVSTAHEQAAELFDAYKSILARRNGAPVIMLAKMLDGKGHFTRTKWTLTKSMFDVITAKSIPVSRFFKPVPGKNEKPEKPETPGVVTDAIMTNVIGTDAANSKPVDAFDEFQREFVLELISEDIVTDANDKTFALAALSLIKSNASEEEFGLVVDQISHYIDVAVAEDPATADTPACLASKYICDIIPRLPQCIVAPLNCLADMM